MDSDNTADYKVTATYDPDAADVSGTISFSGKIDVYLIPLIGMYSAASCRGARVSEPGDYAGANGVEVLGPWYQAFPRSYWPSYVDPYQLEDFTALAETYLEYQKQRADAVASLWTHLSPTEDISYSALDPSDFRTGNNTWCQVVSNSAAVLYSDGGATANTAIVPEPNILGNVFYLMTGPQLLAVIKVGGTFYYVWSVDYGDGITTATEALNGIAGYLLRIFPLGDEPADVTT